MDARNFDIKSLKVQSTLTGYFAWVVERLVAERRQTNAEVTKYIVERWIEDNEEFLSRYNVTRADLEAFEKGRGQLINLKEKA